MQNLINKLTSIELKVRKLSAKYEYLLKENSMLLEENIKLRREILNINKNLYINTQTEIGTPTFVHGKEALSPGKDLEEVKNMRSEIDHYIAEIDKCIELAQVL
jgi:hypothetical protein